MAKKIHAVIFLGLLLFGMVEAQRRQPSSDYISFMGGRSSLPAAGVVNQLAIVTDCANSLCTTGSGSQLRLMRDNGTSWDPIGDGDGRTRIAHFKFWGSGASNVLQDSDDELSILNNAYGGGITITKVTCEADTGTPTLQIQRDDGTPTNMLSSNLSCATTPASTTSFVSGENAIADGNRVDSLVVSAGGSAHWIAVTITYTVD